MFVAIQCGVYRHEVLGAWPDLADAIEASKVAIRAERDHYHDYDIVFVDGAEVDDVGCVCSGRRHISPGTLGLSMYTCDPYWSLSAPRGPFYRRPTT